MKAVIAEQDAKARRELDLHLRWPGWLEGFEFGFVNVEPQREVDSRDAASAALWTGP
jgi:hypothetical protein